ncbi:MAG TPA: hypothetical protein VFO91_16365 [Anaerolineales bacterium]|nr:hypothetical protein [Anaerolineales bacterium]
MDTTDTLTIVIAVVVLLVLVGLFAMLFARRQRTKRLQERFGREYDRTVKEVGDRRQAEAELESRLDHVKSLEIRPLSPEETERYTREWQIAQAEFVDEPLASVQKANRLIKEVMSAKGYPVDDFEQRAADISVDYPDLVIDYRELRAIANKGKDDDVTTEEMRQAMVHARALFENLVQPETKVKDTDQKEKM